MRALIAIAVLVSVASAPAAHAKDEKKEGNRPDGQALFSENCAYCHGSGGKGDGPNAKHLKPPPADLTKSSASEDAIAGVVRDGKGSCPAWRASFSEAEITAVARWAKSLQKR